MSECARDQNSSTSAPPGFSNTNVLVKRRNLIEILQQTIQKCQEEPTFLVEQPKQIDLLVSVAQLTLLSASMTVENRRDFLNNILTIGQNLLSDESGKIVSIETTINPIETQRSTTDNDFSLDDLANEYLQNEPTPPSSTESITIVPITTSVNADADGDLSLDDLANEYLQNDKPKTLSESEEPALAFDNHSKPVLSSSAPVTNILSSLIFPPAASEPIVIKTALESILYSNRLSSSDAADDADCIWKDHSSTLGQIFCTKIEEIPIVVTRRVSSCLLDRTLYERLARLVSRLPKQCVRPNVQQQTIRPNDQNHRSTRPNHDNRRPPPANRTTFQQNSAQMYNRQQLPQNPRPYSNYSNQQTNPNGYFNDRRQQQQQQQQNRYPQPNFAPYPMDQPQPPKNNSNNQQQQKKKPQNNNQTGSNQHYPPQQRGPKKGGGGAGAGAGGKHFISKNQ